MSLGDSFNSVSERKCDARDCDMELKYVGSCVTLI
jgi:hypothetical protein